MIATSAGDVDITLGREATPCTVNSFVSLAEQGYFDDTECHRITTQGIFVLQCGDPSATGMGGPGYSFGDELTGERDLPRRHAGDGQRRRRHQRLTVLHRLRRLPARPSYTVFGTVGEAGLKVVQDIAAKGAQGGAPDGPPAEKVTIDSVTVG